MILPLQHFLVFAAALFVIGVFGALVRRNIISSAEARSKAANKDAFPA